MALWDANTLVKCDAAKVAVDLSVPASRIVGRKAAGGIAALTGAEALAIIDSALTSKIVQITRDLAEASGAVAYTGVGFKPTALVALGYVNGQVFWSIGFSDSAKAVFGMFHAFDGLMGPGGFAWCYQAAGAYQYAVVASYDADGFTLTWTKVGLPVGTFIVNILCLK